VNHAVLPAGSAPGAATINIISTAAMHTPRWVKKRGFEDAPGTLALHPIATLLLLERELARQLDPIDALHNNLAGSARGFGGPSGLISAASLGGG
jgi:hypothetical protein